MSEEIREIWRKADAVCFDVDSTVIKEEGIDELANFCGKGDDIRNLTSKAMSGGMTFQESLKVRLNILQPKLEQIKEFLRLKPATLTPGIKDLIQLLHRRKVPVYLVSGGFRCLIEPVAELIHVPRENIYANRLKFYFSGEYAGFDENQPTSKSGGKAVVAGLLKENFKYKNLVFIGDGATDLEAHPPADAFIGFGGNVIREAVKSKAKWFVTDFKELIDELKL